MSSNADARSKAEIAHSVTQWATEELGFRRPSTLVSAKGEEKIKAADVEPLLQGDLVRILDLATRHVVSSRRALYSRHKLAAFCAQPDPKPAQLPYIALRRSLKQLEARENILLTEIQSVELDNRAAIQSIGDIESKRNAMEARIRDLRLQILVKQAVAEKIRRLSKRMRVLVQEMTSCYSSTQATASSMDLSWSADAGSSMHTSGALAPSDRIDELIAQLQNAKPAHCIGVQGPKDAIPDDAFIQRQLMIACIISCLKDLEDQHVQMWSTVKALRSRITEGRSELDRKIELAASQLNMSVASAGGSALDFRTAILRAVIQDAVSQVGHRVGSLVPALEIADVCSWVSDDHTEAVSDLVESIERVRALLAATRSAAQEAAEYAATRVAPTNESLLKASHYSDMRETWNAVELISLRHINIDSNHSQFRSADKLVTRSSFMDSGRSKVISDICRETVVGGVAGQTHEATIAKLRDQLARGRMDASAVDIEGLSLQDAVELAGQRSQAIKDEARKVLEAWAKGSNAAGRLKTASESVEAEASIAQLSDTSGRLFTELFAPWHKRDGVEYAEYLKQLKIARASEAQQ
ncbi:hypothetical protein IW152_000857 [Coemansia sp. BCRC 34962]|nr:hypothetical protein IW152_000857 [Coemansia sp. BCRC 34962]